MKSHGVGALLAPRNVVLVGASDRPGHWSKRVWANLQRFGFAGNVFPVNPRRTEIWDTTCYPGVDALPESPDHLALFVPADTTLEVIRRAASLGARSATIFAAGFGEGGDPAGKALAADLKALVAETGIAVAGPNCIGIASGAARFVTMADELLHELRPGPIAVATQSGMLASTMNRALTDRDLDVAYLISAGNQACLTFADYIDHFADDADVRVIVCYIETVLDRDRFLAAASKARSNGKSVVAVKIGGSEASRSAALAHTGNLAGRLEVFDAYTREAGIIRVGSLEEMVEAAEYLAHATRPAGPNVAFMTNSGAAKSLITETAGRHNLKLATISETTQSKICGVLGKGAEATNPLDTKLTIPTEKYMGCISALAQAPEIDLVVAIEELPREEGIARKVANFTTLQAYCAEQQPGKSPVAILSPLHLHDTAYMRELRAALPGLPFMRGLGIGIGSLATLTHTDGQGSPAEPYPALEPMRTILQASAKSILAPTPLSEVRSKEIISGAGILLPKEVVAQTPEEAAARAQEIGFPVVVKAIAPSVPHKSDAGLVMLNLADADEVLTATDIVAQRAANISAELDGFLVAEHLSDGVEVLIGIHRDPEMGLAVMVGTGGVLLELIDDVAVLTPSVDHAAALKAIASTRLATMLKGYRGSPPRDISALADAVVAMGRLAATLGDLLESVDVNPVLVRDAGQGIVALDALVVLRPTPDT